MNKMSIYKGIIMESCTIACILCILTVKSFFVTKTYINQIMKITEGYTETSLIGIIGLFYILVHTVLLIVMTVILVQLVKFYYNKLNVRERSNTSKKKYVSQINRIVLLIVTVLIFITSIANISDVLGLEKIGTELGLSHRIIFYFLIRIPTAVMNTSTLIILSVMTIYSVKLYEEITGKMDVFSIIYSVLYGITGYIVMVFSLNVLEIQQLLKSRGQDTDLLLSVKVFNLYFIKNSVNMKEILNHQNILGVLVIIATGIFLLIQMKKEKKEEIIF